MKKLRSFSSKLMFLFSLSTILPIIIMVLILCNYFTAILSEQNRIQFQNTLNSVSNNIDTYTDDLERLTLTPYMYKEISFFMEFINNGNYQKNINDIYGYTQNKNYSSTLNKLINQSRQDIVGISFIPYKDMSNGYLVSKYYDTLSQINIPSNYDPWINSTLKADGDTFFTPVHPVKYNNSGNEYEVFSVMRVIKNLDTKKVIGIVKIDAKEHTIKNIISSVKLTHNSMFMLLDQNGQIIYSRNTPTNITCSDDIISNKELNKFYDIVSTPINSNSWILLYLGSKEDLYSEVNTVSLVILLIALFFFVLTIIFFRINSNRMIESVTNITSIMKKVRDGDLTVRCEVEEDDEFKFISEALNKMIINLDSHIKNEYSSLIAVKNAEYLALQSQINPHFLCNVLNGFVALNRIGEKKLLEDSIIQLSSLYRYTCSNANISTLKDEFMFIQRYLSLQKLRFDDMIDFKITLAEDTSNIEIPKLILQPLVENSIKHGLKNFDKPIFIEATSQLDTNEHEIPKLKINISDNGSGFFIDSSHSTNSTGLKNVQERIKYFNKNAKFIINSEVNKGTFCYIEIPIGGNIYENINS